MLPRGSEQACIDEPLLVQSCRTILLWLYHYSYSNEAMPPILNIVEHTEPQIVYRLRVDNNLHILIGAGLRTYVLEALKTCSPIKADRGYLMSMHSTMLRIFKSCIKTCFILVLNFQRATTVLSLLMCTLYTPCKLLSRTLLKSLTRNL